MSRISYRKNINRLLKDINFRARFRCPLPYLHDLEFTISVLEDWEKQLLMEEIYKIEYQEGTGVLLQVFDRIGLISIEDYIASITDSDLFLNILDDFFESHPPLFAKLVESAVDIEYTRGMELNCKLRSYLKDYVYDLFLEPDVTTVNYFNFIWPHLSEKGAFMVYEHVVENLLSMDPVGLNEAIGMQHIWRQKDIQKKNSVLDAVLNESLSSLKIAKRLLDLVKQTIDSINWRFYTMFLRILSRNLGTELLSTVKEFLQKCFQGGIQQLEDSQLYLMFLTARELSVCLPAFGDYQPWYKATIGEMRYKIKRDEFKYVLKVMSGLVNLEKNPEVLEVHLKTAIPAPVHCASIVVTYKAVVKSKIEALSNVPDQDGDVVMLDDSSKDRTDSF